MLRLLICGDFAPRLDMIAVTKVLKLFYLLFFLELRNNYIKEGPDQNIVDPDPDSIYSKRKECLVSYINKTNRPHQKQHGGPLEAHLITDMRTHIYARIRLHIPYLANATGRP